MPETHTDFFVFWLHCIQAGWGIGYGFFDAVVTICLLVSAGISLLLVLFKNLKPKKWKWKPWEDTLMRIAFAIFAFSFLIVAGLIGPFREFQSKENEANTSKKMVESLSVSNANLNGQIEGGKEMVRLLKDQIKDTKQENETALLNLKTDLNDANRQRDSALQRLDFFEANPERFFNVYSNIFAKTPTNFAQFDLAFEQFSNAVDRLGYDKATFKLTINQTDLTNVDISEGAVYQELNVPLTNGNEINMNLIITSKTTPAINPNIDFVAYIDATNISAPHWELEPISGNGKNHWHIVYPGSIAIPSSFLAFPIRILPTFGGQLLDAQVFVHSDNSAPLEYGIRLMLAK